MNKKKIFIVIGGFGLGGTEKQLFLKAKYLKDKYNLTIIFFYQKGELYKDFKELGVKLIDLTNTNKIKLLRYINIFINLWIILKKKKTTNSSFLSSSLLPFRWTARLFLQKNQFFNVKAFIKFLSR